MPDPKPGESCTMPIAASILIIILLILANGFFSMTEFALISARKARLQKRAADGDAGAVAALELADDPTQFLSTIQVGITVVGILAGAFGGATLAGPLAGIFSGIPLLAPYSGPLAVAIVVAAITYLTLVIGELVPKRVAMGNAERIACRVARPMRFLARVGAPLVQLLSVSTETVLTVLGVRQPSGPEVTEEDIRILIEQATRAGIFREAEQDMVESVFRLGDRRVSVLMTPRPDVVAVDVEDPPEENWQKMVESGHVYFPVYREHLDNLLGVVSVRNLWARMIKGEPQTSQRRSSPPSSCPRVSWRWRSSKSSRPQAHGSPLSPTSTGASRGWLRCTTSWRRLLGVSRRSSTRPRPWRSSARTGHGSSTGCSQSTSFTTSST